MLKKLGSVKNLHWAMIDWIFFPEKAVSIYILPFSMVNSFLKSGQVEPSDFAVIFFKTEAKKRPVIEDGILFFEAEVLGNGFLEYDSVFKPLASKLKGKNLSQSDLEKIILASLEEDRILSEIFYPKPALELSSFLEDSYKKGIRHYVFACNDGFTFSAGAAKAFAKWLFVQGERHRTFSLYESAINWSLERQLSRALLKPSSLIEKERLESVKDLEELIERLDTLMIGHAEKLVEYFGEFNLTGFLYHLSGFYKLLYMIFSIAEKDLFIRLIVHGQLLMKFSLLEEIIEEVDLQELIKIIKVLEEIELILWRLGF